MATLKLEIVAGGTTYTNTKTISAAHLTRFIGAMRIKLDLPSPTFTDAQVADAWFNKIFAMAKDDTRIVENQVASTAAVVAGTDIAFT